MSQNEQNVPNFTVEQLVTIGDAIHNSTNAIILADNQTANGHNVTVCLRGTEQTLYNMMYNVLLSNPMFARICADAVVNYEIEKRQSNLS
jgi:hypothetical protein